MNYRLYLILAGLLLIQNIFAQSNNDNELAIEYFQKKQYDKAVSLYENLYNRTGADVYFTYLIECYTQLSDFKAAEKVIKKRIKSNPNDLTSLVYLGSLYLEEKETDKANKQFEKAIDEIGADEQQVIALGDAFIEIRKLEYAKASYLKGRKLFKDYGFYIELAKLHQLNRDYNGMIGEYLDLLDTNDAFLESVQNRLQAQIVYDVDGTVYDILRQELITKIQKKPNVLVFNELLIWLFIQKKDFKQAYNQSIAIDKRFDENGSRIYEVGTLAKSNNDYVLAIKCFQYILDSKDSKSIIYRRSKRQLLSTQYEYFTNSANFTRFDLENLNSNYKKTIGELGVNNETMSLVREYAYLLCFYLQQTDTAITLIDSALLQKNISALERDKTQLLRADLFVANDDIWEASLIYARIEKEHQNDPLGHEAKFKRARVYYFAGEFEFAKAMLDVLKASTSKLIANDAFELASLINDNTALDTSMAAMIIFSRADLLHYQNKDSLAILAFDSIPKLFPGHSLEDEILFKKAMIFKKKHKYEQAIEFLIQIEERFSYDIYGDDACFYIAELYETVLNNKEKAMEYYKKILSKHQDSIYISIARNRYRALKDKV